MARAMTNECDSLQLHRFKRSHINGEAIPTMSSMATTITTLLYDNPDDRIKIRYPQNWSYIDSGALFTGGPGIAIGNMRNGWILAG
ncbi:MAG TPA: hypothetical protein VE572_04790 [Nitrososphaeraceae archaeon]|jgi:hypothetical protein|nr:hypothetical protein [Nitrososphaeraceae archaeon]